MCEEEEEEVPAHTGHTTSKESEEEEEEEVHSGYSTSKKSEEEENEVARVERRRKATAIQV